MPGLDTDTVHGQIAGKDFWDEDCEEHFLPDRRSTATRTITCDWNDRIDIIAALSGGTTRQGIIETNQPAVAYPDAPWLVVKGCHPQGVGVRKVGPNGMVGYDFARIRIEYGQDEKDLGQTQDLGALSLDIGSEVISPPREGESTFKWKSDNEPVPPAATPSLSVTLTTFERVRRNVAQLPVPLILSLVDHLNDATFEGSPGGHIIFRGARPFRKITNLGLQNWDVSLIFVHRSVPWNYFLRPSTGQFEEVVYKANGKPFFESGNLAALYQ